MNINEKLNKTILNFYSLLMCEVSIYAPVRSDLRELRLRTDFLYLRLMPNDSSYGFQKYLR